MSSSVKGLLPSVKQRLPSTVVFRRMSSSVELPPHFFFGLVHVNNLLFDETVDDVVEEVNVKEPLKSSVLSFRRQLHQNIG